MRRTKEEVRVELERRRDAYESSKRRRQRCMMVTVPVLAMVLVIGAALIPWLGGIRPFVSDSPGAPMDSESLQEPTVPTEPDPPQTIAPIEPGAPGHIGEVDGIVAGGVSSFAELLAAADLIIVGTVTDTTEPSPITETATVLVDSVYRAWNGEMPTEIELYQLKEYDAVRVGNTYLLFLKKQEDGPENAFYAIGGVQGVLRYDAVNGTVATNDSRIDATQMLTWLRETAPLE